MYMHKSMYFGTRVLTVESGGIVNSSNQIYEKQIRFRYTH